MRTIKTDAFVLALTWVELKHQDSSLLAASLSDGNVYFYRQGVTVDKMHFNANIISMTCGKYGREENVLVMVTKGKHYSDALKKLVLFPNKCCSWLT